jgi:hypothetical protein
VNLDHSAESCELAEEPEQPVPDVLALVPGALDLVPLALDPLAPTDVSVLVPDALDLVSLALDLLDPMDALVPVLDGSAPGLLDEPDLVQV